MPLSYKTDHVRRRIHVTVTGALRRADVAQSVSDRVTFRAIDYDTIWDVRHATVDIRNEELRSIVQDYRAALGDRPPGLLVFVAADDLTFGTLRQQEAMLRYFGRDITVCRTVEEAEGWLDHERAESP